jgi:hypothetical protein
VRELVPGDLIALKGGDVIPADCKAGPPAGMPSHPMLPPQPCWCSVAPRASCQRPGNTRLAGGLWPAALTCRWAAAPPAAGRPGRAPEG